MTSLITWIGGKHHIADWIISHFPPHRVYVEVFGGAAHVLLKKELSKMEVYNDISKDLANLFWVAKMHPQELQNEFELMPYSRELYRRYLALWKDGLDKCDEIRHAAVFMYLTDVSFSGKCVAGYGVSSTQHNKARTWHRRIQTIPQISTRLREVEIECVDWRVCISRYDGKDTLFYLDPPYAGYKDYGHIENANWTLDNMQELVDVLNNIEGKAVVSHYETPEIDAMFESWYKDTKEVPLHAAYSPAVSRKKRKVEAVYMNFKPDTATPDCGQTASSNLFDWANDTV